MFGSAILEVAIGVIFIFLLVAIICSAVREAIEGFLKTRAAYLEYGIRELLHDKTATGLAYHFFNHPLIYSLYSGNYKKGQSVVKPTLLANGRNLPSYIPAKNFAVALMDIAARGPSTDVFTSHPSSPTITLESIRANILNIGNQSVQRALLTAIDSAQGDINRAQQNIQDWYDSGMDRVSGWYKRSTQRILFWIGLVVAIALNINTITLADYLYKDDAARAALVAKAEAAAADTTLRNGSDYASARLALDSLKLPMGWENGLGTTKAPITTRGDMFWFQILAPALGWIMTALAAMMGAPFWFDTLNKVMVIRSTVKPHEKSPEESSEDRQKKEKELVAAVTPDHIAPSPAVPPPPTTPPGPEPDVDESIFSGGDLESQVDACDVQLTDVTADEDLPEARGGVALL